MHRKREQDKCLVDEFEHPLRIVPERSDAFAFDAVAVTHSERLHRQHEAAMLERIAQNVEMSGFGGDGVIQSVR